MQLTYQDDRVLKQRLAAVDEIDAVRLCELAFATDPDIRTIALMDVNGEEVHLLTR